MYQRLGGVAAVVVVGAGLLAGCEESAESTAEAGAVVRWDSAGVEMVSTSRAVWADGGGWTVDPEPLLSIGEVVGDAPYLFGEVRGAVRLDDGSVVVVDNQARELRFYDASGTFIRAVGGPGEGPSEFRTSAYYLQRCGEDRLYVFDPWSDRVTAWSTSGEFLRSFDLKEPVPPRRSPYAQTCRPDGGFVALGWGDLSAVPKLPDGSEAMLYSQYAPAWALDEHAEVELEFGDFLSSERILTRNGSGPHPFGRALAMAAGDAGIFLGTGEGLRVGLYRDGRLSEVWIGPDGDLQLDDSFPQDYRRAEIRELDERERRFILEGEVEMPPALPAYTDLQAAPDGHLWAKRFIPPWEDTHRWGVFAPDGTFLGDLEFPPGLEVTEVGDHHIVGIATDELGVQTVRVHRIVR